LARRFLIDAQLPPKLCGWLAEHGHSAVHVSDVLTGQAPDSWVVNHARQQAMVLVTKDDDFVLRHPPTDYALVWLRCGNMSNRLLRAWLDTRWAAIEAKLDEGERVIEVR
jgi:predicted nuclease of predicted toxin-antitoxin system